MNKTAIEWCDYTWNPVTGCLHGCEYCYAKTVVKRFGLTRFGLTRLEDMKLHTREELYDKTKYSYFLFHELMANSYPFGFSPTFHNHRLDEPQKLKKPSNIFVCSMADLFGEWVPGEWIQEVFEACEAAPQHRYLFLTKNPYRYMQLNLCGRLPNKPNIWYGTTINESGKLPFQTLDFNHNFISIEPLLGEMSDKFPFKNIQWVIIGAETGNRKGKIIPKREWIQNIVEQCKAASVPVFMKNSLAGIWGEPLIQEYPWAVD